MPGCSASSVAGTAAPGAREYPAKSAPRASYTAATRICGSTASALRYSGAALRASKASAAVTVDARMRLCASTCCVSAPVYACSLYITITAPASTSSRMPAAATAGMKFARSMPRIVRDCGFAGGKLGSGRYTARQVQQLRADDEVILRGRALIDFEADAIILHDEVDDPRCAGVAR